MKKSLKILLAPDSFKESMTAKEACMAMERGIKKVDSSAICIHVPMADGGEGTMQSLVDATGGRCYAIHVVGPLGEEVQAEYGILGDGETAVLEMASASGLHLVPQEKRNPMLTTTYGTGQLIKACLDHGVKKLIIGIGGSATNDGGSGAMQALGAGLLDASGNDIGFGGGELNKLCSIDLSSFDKRLSEVLIEIACDVTNPLCGERGASRVYGRQKGATEQMAEVLDSNLKHYAQVIQDAMGKDVRNIPGAGAAGGLGAGLMAFLDGKLKKGIDLVIAYTRLEEKIRNGQVDMVWTGEGAMDFQTQYGKTPVGVAKVAKEYGKPVVAFTGQAGEGVHVLYNMGIDSIFCIMQGTATLEAALKDGQVNLERSSENVTRLLLAMQD